MPDRGGEAPTRLRVEDLVLDRLRPCDHLRGLLKLDDPVDQHLVELTSQPMIGVGTNFIQSPLDSSQHLPVNLVVDQLRNPPRTFLADSVANQLFVFRHE
jgi:hypothetical protein